MGKKDIVYKNQSHCKILLAGVSGQGIHFGTQLLAEIFHRLNFSVTYQQTPKQFHRGSELHSTIFINTPETLLLADTQVDVVIAFEQIEAIRVLDHIAPDTQVILHQTPIIPYGISQKYVQGDKQSKYPSKEEVLTVLQGYTNQIKAVHIQDTTDPRYLNTFLLGCLFATNSFSINHKEIEKVLTSLLDRDTLDGNISAWKCGLTQN